MDFTILLEYFKLFNTAVGTARSISYVNSILKTGSESIHEENYELAFSLYEKLMQEQSYTVYDYFNVRQAIDLLNEINNKDKKYLFCNALLLKTMLYLMLSDFEKCYKCLQKIEDIDTTLKFGFKFSIKHYDNIVEIKKQVPLLRKEIEEAEKQLRIDIEKQESLEKEKENRIDNLYAQIEAIDAAEKEAKILWNEAKEEQKKKDEERNKKDVELNNRIATIESLLKQLEESFDDKSSQFETIATRSQSILQEIKAQITEDEEAFNKALEEWKTRDDSINNQIKKIDISIQTLDEKVQQIIDQEAKKPSAKLQLWISIASVILSLAAIIMLIYMMLQ